MAPLSSATSLSRNISPASTGISTRVSYYSLFYIAQQTVFGENLFDITVDRP
jgi:hypothetical protein